MAQRKKTAFRFPLQKYEDEKALYTNFRYLQEYLRNIAANSIHTYEIVVKPFDSKSNAHADIELAGDNDQIPLQQAIDDGFHSFYILDGTVKLNGTGSGGDALTMTGSTPYFWSGAGTDLTVIEQASDSDNAFWPSENIGRLDLQNFTFEDAGTGLSLIASSAVGVDIVMFRVRTAKTGGSNDAIRADSLFMLECEMPDLGSQNYLALEGDSLKTLAFCKIMRVYDGGPGSGDCIIIGNHVETWGSLTFGTMIAVGNIVDTASSGLGGSTVDIIGLNSIGGAAVGVPLTQEQVEDFVGGMVTGNTETLITVTYEDSDGTLDFVVDEANIDHGSIAGLTDDDHTQYLLADGTRQATYLDVSGLTGATAGHRYVGATTSGAPTSGTFVVGDVVVAEDGGIFICTTGGSPGTWAPIGKMPNSDNYAIGVGALDALTTGFSNVAIGQDALGALTEGTRNFALGSSGTAITTGERNIAIGFTALNAVTTAGENTAIGAVAGTQLTSSQNTAIGSLALQTATSGTNTVIGYKAGNAISTGDDNTAIGNSALQNATTPNNSVAIGTDALGNGIVTGNDNVAIGRRALRDATSGDNNVVVGSVAGFLAGGLSANKLTTGRLNVFVGTQAGFGSSTQRDQTVALGFNATVDANAAVALGRSASANHADAVALGADVTTTAANQVAIEDRHIELTEITAPGNGAANSVRFYAVDDGAGKTQLAAIFGSGAVQILATEP